MERKIEYRLVPNGDEADVWALCDGFIRMAAARNDPLTIVAVSGLGGERHTCCDEAVVAWAGDIPAGIATIAPQGESGAGQAEIVGLFVLEEWRGSIWVAGELLARAVRRCRERGVVPVRFEALSSLESAAADNLPPEEAVYVEVTDMSGLLPF